MKRAAAAGYWLLPPLLCILLYRYGWKSWFQADDFAWLTHAVELQRGEDFWHFLFAPMAQGTIRPWSERLFFLVFYTIFGLNALPFRIWVFLTQFANLALVQSITTRLTGARLAGLAAALLWMANISVATVMSWNSVYNEALCGFFLLGAFHFLLRYFETGRRRDWILQWILFLLGFGALELIVVYPALAAGYAFLCARKHFRRTLPLFVPSIVFTVVHRLAAPPAPGVYAMHFDASMIESLLLFWRWALGPEWLASVWPLPFWLATVATILLSAALLGFVAWSAWRRRFLPLFLLAWFLIVLAPVLPLTDHRSEYYGFLPSIGLAMLGAVALAHAWRKGAAAKVVAAALAMIYLAASVPATRISTRWIYERARGVKILVTGVARARELHPGKIILLKGVDDGLFWTGMLDHPFPLVGAYQVYLTPGSETAIRRHPELGDPMEYILPAGATLRALDRDEAVVYQVGGERLKNITSIYAAMARNELRPEPPRRVDAGNPVYAYALGPTWYELHGNTRWMPRRATVRMAAPRSPNDKLRITGYCPPEPAPAHLSVSVDGIGLPARQLAPASTFDLEFRLPPSLPGRETMEITLEVDRLAKAPQDTRELGLVFGIFELR